MSVDLELATEDQIGEELKRRYKDAVGRAFMFVRPGSDDTTAMTLHGTALDVCEFVNAVAEAVEEFGGSPRKVFDTVITARNMRRVMLSNGEKKKLYLPA